MKELILQIIRLLFLSKKTLKKKITLSFEIPLSDDNFSGSHLYFNQWIPTKEHSILMKEEEYTLKIWADKDCTSSILHKTDEEISKWSNISVYKLKVEVIIENIDQELATFIYNERSRGRQEYVEPALEKHEYDKLSEEFRSLSLNVLRLVYKTCNKIIAFARNNKGQYELEQLTFNENLLHSLYVQIKAKCKIDEGEWFWWNPNVIDSLTINIGTAGYIKENDWKDIKTFVAGNRSINLANELLSNSMSLLFKFEHRRSAVIEAATALEITLAKFSQAPDLSKIDCTTDGNRIDLENIKNQVQHLGFSASMRYLIPILFKEDVLSTELLNKVFKAIQSRNNIVHKGQRDISVDKAEEHISSLKKCSEILMEYTVNEEEPNKT